MVLNESFSIVKRYFFQSNLYFKHTFCQNPFGISTFEHSSKLHLTGQMWENSERKKEQRHLV